MDLDYSAASSMRIEIHLIVPDHLGDVLAKTSENACVGDLATKFVSATGTVWSCFLYPAHLSYNLYPHPYLQMDALMLSEKIRQTRLTFYRNDMTDMTGFKKLTNPIEHG